MAVPLLVQTTGHRQSLFIAMYIGNINTGCCPQGVMRADPKSTKVGDDVVRLWLHECDRVFADRLVNDEDRQWLKDAQGGLTSSMFGRSYEDVVTTERLVFGDFMIPSMSPIRSEPAAAVITDNVPFQSARFCFPTSPMLQQNGWSSIAWFSAGPSVIFIG